MKKVIWSLICCLVIISINTTSAQDATDAEMREWSNKKGRKIIASYLSYEDGKVKLTLKNGKSASVPIDSLSDKDAKWVKALIAKEEKAKQLETEKIKHFPKDDQLTAIDREVIYPVNDKIQRKYFFINSKGDSVLEHLLLVGPAQRFSEGLSFVTVRKSKDSNETLSGFINRKGEWVLGGDSGVTLPEGGEILTGFREGLAVFRKYAAKGSKEDRKCGYMDKRGRLVLPANKFLRLDLPIKGKAVASYKKGKVHMNAIVDTKGNILREDESWSSIQTDGDFILVANYKNNKQILDIDGKVVYEPAKYGLLRGGIFIPNADTGVVKLKDATKVVNETKGIRIHGISFQDNIAVIYSKDGRSARLYNLATGGAYGATFSKAIPVQVENGGVCSTFRGARSGGLVYSKRGSVSAMFTSDKAPLNTFADGLMTFIEKKNSDQRTVVVNRKGEFIYKGLSRNGEEW